MGHHRGCVGRVASLAWACPRRPAKLADFDAFVTSMRLDVVPEVPHLTVDNRLTVTSTLREQVAAAR